MSHASATADAICWSAFGDDGCKIILDTPGTIDLILIIYADKLRDIDLLRTVGCAVTATGARDVDVGAEHLASLVKQRLVFWSEANCASSRT